MNQNIYILLEILDGRTLRAWHFAAKDVQRCAQKIVELHQKDKTYFENAYWVSGFTVWAKTEIVDIESFLTYLKNSEAFAEQHKCSNYRLFNQCGEAHEMFEVAIKGNISKGFTKQDDYKIEPSKPKKYDYQFFTNYPEILDKDTYRVSKDPFDFNWVSKFPKLNERERNHFGHSIAKKEQNAYTLAVYFDEHDDPVLIHRRSTVKKGFQWLVAVNEFCLWEYERITWSSREYEHRSKKIAQYIAQQTEQTQKDNLIQDLKLQALKEAYKKDQKDRLLVTKAKFDLEKERFDTEVSNWKIFKDECYYFANVWLYGHSQQGMNNINNLLYDIDCFDTPWFMDTIDW